MKIHHFEPLNMAFGILKCRILNYNMPHFALPDAAYWKIELYITSFPSHFRS